MPLTKKREDTVTFPLSVFKTADTIEDLEDWLLSKNPEFIRRMRKARQEDIQGKGKNWEVDEECELLAREYISKGIIPEKYEDDAFHIAVASANDMDAIISWNFSHIVKLKTKREVVGVNILMGYKEIDIYSPREVVEDEGA